MVEVLLPIRFAEPQAILCLNGTLPAHLFFETMSHLPIIAADGAALQLHKLKLTPSIIVGDLDSFRNELDIQFYSSVPILYAPDQNSTDFEKCLEYCLSQGFTSVVICGIHGGEMEHSLNNWSIVVRYGRKINLCIFEENRYGFPIFKSALIPAKIGETISLIPQPNVRISTKGLQWELNNEVLALGMREGARNSSVAEIIEITIFDGELLYFCDARLPMIPILPE